MDTEQMGPATPPREAARALYREALLAWRIGDHDGFKEYLGLARDCALISQVLIPWSEEER